MPTLCLFLVWAGILLHLFPQFVGDMEVEFEEEASCESLSVQLHASWGTRWKR